MKRIRTFFNKKEYNIFRKEIKNYIELQNNKVSEILFKNLGLDLEKIEEFLIVNFQNNFENLKDNYYLYLSFLLSDKELKENIKNFIKIKPSLKTHLQMLVEEIKKKKIKKYKAFNEIRKMLYLNKEKLKTLVECSSLKRPAYLYQFWLANMVNLLDSLFLFLEMGLGKTKISIDSINLSKDLKKMLIVVPPHLINNWIIELSKDLNRKNLQIFNLNDKRNFKNMKAKEKYNCIYEKLINEENIIFIASYNILQNLIKKKENEIEKLLYLDKKIFDLIIIDEIHYCKNEKSNNYIVAKTFSYLSKKGIYLTGTPIARTSKDLVNIINIPSKVIDIKLYEKIFMKEDRRFRTRSGEEIVTYKDIEGKELKTIKNIYISLKTNDVFYMRDIIEEEIINIASEKTIEVFEQIGQNFLSIDVDDEKTIEKEIKNVIIKLNQLNSEFIYVDGKKYKLLSQNKLNLLKDLIDDEFINEDKPIFIWYKFQAEAEILLYFLNKKYKNYKTKVLDKKDLDNLEKILSENKFILMQIERFAEGLNLQKYTNKMIYYNLTYNFVKYYQSQKRIHRIGQDKNVYLYIINTYIDDKPIVNIMKNLENKKKLSDKYTYLKETFESLIEKENKK